MAFTCSFSAVSCLALLSALLIAADPATADLRRPGGVRDGGAAVTVHDNGNDTVTMSNGIATIVIVTKTARLNSIAYTYQQDGKTVTSETLLGNGQYYYGGFMLGSGTFTYSLATDPAANGGDYGDVKLMSVSESNGTMEAHFSLLRGSPGFYSTAIMTHRTQDQAFEVGAWGVVTRVPKMFNWVSADSKRDFFIGEPTTKGVGVPDSPHEIGVSLDGTQQGTYGDKFIYGQDHANLRAWGWSSVGAGGLNIGRWIMTNMEFSDGGPLKRDVSVYPYSELNNSILTGEVGMGSDGFMDKGEVWTKTCGPWFMYLNHLPTTDHDAKAAAKRLFDDATDQAAVEAAAWPYAWFKHEQFIPASGRGTVTGTIAITDSGNPQASAGGLWVGVQIQPTTYKGFYDFQKWLKTYQFWVRTAPDGRFTIPHVHPGERYCLFAFGPGAAGTFQSHELEGGQSPNTYDLPAKPFFVTAKAGEVTDLGTITWTPARRGATVFELGTPNRKADEFRHGEDYWNPGTPPKLGFPTPVWGGQMEFPLDFPDGMTYVVGTSQWPRDWNYVLPAMADASGGYRPCTGTIAFDLSRDPPLQGVASFYLGCAGNDGKSVIITVNGTNLGDVPGVVAVPNPVTPQGFCPAYSDTSSIHFSDHGPFCDERITFPAKLVHAGRNTLSITMDTRNMTAYLMVDYLRLEMSGYIPPAPAHVLATAGNGRIQVSWLPAPGATSYTISRARAGSSDFAPIAAGVSGPVCGSGTGPATFIDTMVTNGSDYAYAVEAVNPEGTSGRSAPCLPATPMSDRPTTAPPAPLQLTVTGSGHHRVDLRWNEAPSASAYVLWRTTLHEDGVGGWYPIGTIRLDETTQTTITDSSPSDGRIYSYQVTASNAAGVSAASDPVRAIPLPPAPTGSPQGLNAAWKTFRDGVGIVLSWSPVPGATGYVIYRKGTSGEAFAWPGDFHCALVETTWFDKGDTRKTAKVKGLDPSKEYYYRVTAVNAGGISTSAVIHVPAR
jgi:rhamnogalacturonan endolyase